ncbi:DedA family protein [Pantoea sp. Nvir]|uniref:DedA family protein n=1 Tax=Pantoea sp. Nvir TaxID=2576760 RepID=UPI0013595E7D|nr:DedA family protein [Pantoea sp. Nvir]MXP66306.1 DedA family protein [Pantoea sp. Nvir]CAJ0992898.1 Inner membrane protein YohD [Pantoea sp. Nvir]
MHLDINLLIEKYGYLAMLIGCIAEGETFTLLGGVAANEGLLNFGGVVLAAMGGGIIGDQLLYWIGRRYGTKIFLKMKKHRDKLMKANRLIQRYPSSFVIGVRFMYGFRIIGPIIIGASHLKPMKFFILNIVGAVIWAITFVALGYFADGMMMFWIHKLDDHLKQIIWLVAAVVFAFITRWVIRYWNTSTHRAG